MYTHTMSDLAAKFGIQVVQTASPLRTLAEISTACMLAVALYFAFRMSSQEVKAPRARWPGKE